MKNGLFYFFSHLMSPCVISLFLVTVCAGSASTSAGGLKQEEAQVVQTVHEQVNAFRASKGLKPLVLDLFLNQIAAQHTADMANKVVSLGHGGFSSRVAKIQKKFSTRAVAENVGSNLGYADPAETVVREWIGSKSHRNNIIGKFSRTGIGVAKNKKGQYFFTQIFLE